MRTKLLMTAAIAGVLACAQPVLAGSMMSGTPQVTDSDQSAEPVPANDPLEPVNRHIFDFNVMLDRNVMKPVASAYHEIPSTVRTGIHNELTNLSEPLNVVHGVLRLNPKIVFTSVWRFILNTTVGLGGLRDFAGENGLHNMDQNLGNTMGRWGVPSGPYVVLPLFGPSSVRDTVGKGGDVFLDPVNWELTFPESIGVGAVNAVSTRDTYAKAVDQFYYKSLDPYVALRTAFSEHEAYLANRKELWRYEK